MNDDHPCECDHSRASHKRGPCTPPGYSCGKSCQGYVLPRCRLGVQQGDGHRHCYAHGGTVEIGDPGVCDRVRELLVPR